MNNNFFSDISHYDLFLYEVPTIQIGQIVSNIEKRFTAHYSTDRYIKRVGRTLYTRVETETTVIFYTSKLSGTHHKDMYYGYSITFDKKTGKVKRIRHCEYGLLHHDNFPAEIDFERGILKWYTSGNLDRKDGPAYIDLKERLYKWYRNGLCTREGDKPSIINYNLKRKEWHKYGHRHREKYPAIINYTEGNAWWCNNGKTVKYAEFKPTVDFEDEYLENVEFTYIHKQI